MSALLHLSSLLLSSVALLLFHLSIFCFPTPTINFHTFPIVTLHQHLSHVLFTFFSLPSYFFHLPPSIALHLLTFQLFVSLSSLFAWPIFNPQFSISYIPCFLSTGPCVRCLSPLYHLVSLCLVASGKLLFTFWYGFKGTAQCLIQPRVLRVMEEHSCSCTCSQFLKRLTFPIQFDLILIYEVTKSSHGEQTIKQFF